MNILNFLLGPTLIIIVVGIILGFFKLFDVLQDKGYNKTLNCGLVFFFWSILVLLKAAAYYTFN